MALLESTHPHEVPAPQERVASESRAGAEVVLMTQPRKSQMVAFAAAPSYHGSPVLVTYVNHLSQALSNKSPRWPGAWHREGIHSEVV